MFKGILYLFQRNPCTSCLVRSCCREECEYYIAWERPHVKIKSILYCIMLSPIIIIYLILFCMAPILNFYIYVVTLPKTLKGGS